MIFSKKPSFAELWDVAVNRLYNPLEYAKELASFLQKYGIDKESKIADVAAGAGFPALLMREAGFSIDCYDLFDDQIRTFRKNAKSQNVSPAITKSAWLDLPEKAKGKEYNFIMCRGNSFIYAPGGWNSSEYDFEHALDKYLKTLKVFYNLLTPNGVLLIDKFKDTEQDHKVKVCEIEINEKKNDLIFYTRLNKKTRERYASMLLKDETGKEEGTPNFTYALSEQELFSLARKANFSRLEEISLKAENNFDMFILQR